MDARTRGAWVLSVLLGGAIWTGACASTRPADEAAPGEGVDPVFAGSLASIGAAHGSVHGADIWPAEPSERSFDATLNGEPRAEVLRIEIPPDAGKNGAPSQIVSWIDADSGDVVSSQRVRIGDDGSVATMSSLDPSRDALSRFRPLLPVLAGDMGAGKPFEQKLEVVVSDPDRPDRVTHRGTGTGVVEYLGKASIEIAGEMVECAVVRTTFTATFGPAVVHRVTHRWYDPGKGPVAEYTEERLKTLGIETDHRVETWIATE